MKTRTAIAIAVTLLALGALVQRVAAEADAYRLAWFVLAGGGTSSGGGYTLQTDVGEPLAGQSAGGGYTLNVGAPVQQAGAPTATPTATVRSPATPTRTPTPTSTPTPTKTPVPSTGDRHEPDNRCDGARTVPTDGSREEHTFAPANDQDWVGIAVEQGVTYRIEAEPVGNSPADLKLELYANCEEAPSSTSDEGFTTAARLQIVAPATTTLYARLFNAKPAIAGSNVRYRLTVRSLAQQPRPGAFIIVAGSLESKDLQFNIEQITGAVYNYAAANGYSDDQILYLSTAYGGLDKRIDGRSTVSNLRNGITQWAAERLEADMAFTIFLMDHGRPGVFYLDEEHDQRLTPAMLDGWISQLEAARPGIKVNIVIEACYSGSFISRTDGISRNGRLVVTSTSDDWTAYASDRGAIFSDQFWTQVNQGYSILKSFEVASTITQGEHMLQVPWLDSNGNRVANETADAMLAAQRGFGRPGTFDPPWQPQITSASSSAAAATSLQLSATITDDKGIARVWAAIYPPSYDPSAPEDKLLPGSPFTVTLEPVAGSADAYTGIFAELTETGVYQITIHAEDSEGLSAVPVKLDVSAGGALYLPLITR